MTVLTHRDKQPFTLTVTPRGDSETANLHEKTCVFFDCGRQHIQTWGGHANSNTNIETQVQTQNVLLVQASAPARHRLRLKTDLKQSLQ